MKIQWTNKYVSETDPNLIQVRQKYGDTHVITAMPASHEIDLTTLDKNESVCWGDGETYYFKLYKRP